MCTLDRQAATKCTSKTGTVWVSGKNGPTYFKFKVVEHTLLTNHTISKEDIKLTISEGPLYPLLHTRWTASLSIYIATLSFTVNPSPYYEDKEMRIECSKTNKSSSCSTTEFSFGNYLNSCSYKKNRDTSVHSESKNIENYYNLDVVLHRNISKVLFFSRVTNEKNI